MKYQSNYKVMMQTTTYHPVEKVESDTGAAKLAAMQQLKAAVEQDGFSFDKSKVVEEPYSWTLTQVTYKLTYET